MKSTTSMLQKASLASLLCMALTSCGSVPTKAFRFQSINVQEVKCPCMIVVNDDWDTALSKKQVFDAAKMDFFELKIPFAKREVAIRAVPIRSDGNVPRSRSELRNNPSRYEAQERNLRLTDPTSQLFVFNLSR
jgi:hypothetical protein